MKAACLVSVWVSDGSSSVGEALKTTAVCVDCGFFVVNFVEMQKKGRSLGTLQGGESERGLHFRYLSQGCEWRRMTEQTAISYNCVVLPEAGMGFRFYF